MVIDELQITLPPQSVQRSRRRCVQNLDNETKTDGRTNERRDERTDERKIIGLLEITLRGDLIMFRKKHKSCRSFF